MKLNWIFTKRLVKCEVYTVILPWIIAIVFTTFGLYFPLGCAIQIDLMIQLGLLWDAWHKKEVLK